MTTISEPTADEAELVHRARSGDDAALESLYTTYVDGARALARRLVGSEAADDLVAEAFARVVAQIRAGRGPTSNFRAYLCTTIRNRHADIAPALQQEQPASDRPWLLDGTEPPLEEALESFDDDDAVAALSSLPHAWRQVLWHLEIEGRRVPEVADLLGTTPAAISSLAYRAREGLKVAYLGQHVADGPAGGECGWVRERLSQFVRGTLGSRAAGKIDGHVPSCARCNSMLTDLQHVNGKLAALVVPILLVGATKGVKVGVLLGGASATSGGVVSFLHGPRPLRPTTTAAIGVGAVAAAAVVAVAAVGLPGADRPDTASPASKTPAGGASPSAEASPPSGSGGAGPAPAPAPPPAAKVDASPVAAEPPAERGPGPDDAPGPAPDGSGDAPAPGPADGPPPAPPQDDPAPPPPQDDPASAPPPKAPGQTGPGNTPIDNHGQQVAAEKAAPPAMDKKPKKSEPPKGKKSNGKPAQSGPPAHAGGKK